jgi:hypothetical protein
VTGEEIANADGLKRVSIAGAGRSNVQNITDYIRANTGVDELLAGLRVEDRDEQTA